MAGQDMRGSSTLAGGRLFGPLAPERNTEERMNHPLWVLGNSLAIAVILLSIALLAVEFSDNLMSIFEETYFFFLRQLGHIKILIGVV